MIRLLLYFLSAVFIFAGIIGAYYFDHYRGTLIPYPKLWMLACIALAGIGALLIYFLAKSAISKANKIATAWKERLKLSGEKILVEFKDVEIKNNFYYEEVQKEYSQTGALLALTGGAAGNDKPEVQSRHASAFVYDHLNPRTGESQRFISPVIAKDKITLEVLLDMQKQTFLYVNKENAQEYFFDLDFLQ